MSDAAQHDTTRPTDHAACLIERHFDTHQGQLLVGGLPIGELAEAQGTPLFLYDARVLQQTWQRLSAATRGLFDIHYSIKANPQQRLLRFFLERGCGLEVASAGEIHQALEAGCPTERLLFAGPGKTNDELRLAVQQQVGEVHIESLTEAERLHEIAADSGATVRVAVRVNPAGEAQGGAMRMGGKPTPFGIDEEDLELVVRRLARLSSLRLVGVHLFSGTQILDHRLLLTQYRRALQIAGRVAKRLARPLETIDFGGGLGIPYFAHERPLDLDAWQRGLAELRAERSQDPRLAKARLIIEPGRFLVGEAGIYLVRVLDVKTSRGKTFVVTDGGMHHHLAASGNLGQTIKRNFPLAVVNQLDRPATETVDVVGPLCTPLDTLGRATVLPRVAAGDLIGILQSGAYARAASPLGFLSHPAPPELWIEDGQVELIRRRGELDDLLADQQETEHGALATASGRVQPGENSPSLWEGRAQPGEGRSHPTMG